ncbi:jg16909 [Pararge aegeria aegeria]|uniref:Jg16909 protein n=1 Tax=Pararge aegeria aegeria TaxID=348720 RepID=A0A8S4SHW0_9NEOP|nr:jg16909 [Pararge aegeria aegeria]
MASNKSRWRQFNNSKLRSHQDHDIQDDEGTSRERERGRERESINSQSHTNFEDFPVLISGRSFPRGMVPRMLAAFPH